MDQNTNKLTNRTILLITGAVFLIIAVLFTVLSLVTMRPEEPDTSSTLSNNSNVPDDNSSAPPESSEDYSDFSNVFAESLPNESSDNSTESDIIEHGWVINEFGYTYLYGDSGYEQFNYNTASIDRYVVGLNRFSSIIPQGTRIYNIVVPVSSTFASIPREVYVADNFYNKSQSAFVSTVASKTDERVINVPIVEKLEAQYDNGDYVFYRTDRNWTSLAAFTAYQSFCEKSGLTAYPITAFSSSEIGPFLGSYYRATSSPTMEDNPDSVTCISHSDNVTTALTVFDNGMMFEQYRLCNNEVDISSATDCYLGRSAERFQITSTADGGSLLIVGDSSAHALIPMLASHYSKIDFIDPECYKSTIPEFLTERSYDDVLTICYSTNAINGNYIPSFNTIIGVKNNE